MRLFKKSVSVILALLMLITVLSVMCVYAVDNEAVITAGDTEVKSAVGESITYSCDLQSGIRILCGDTKVVYPGELLKVKSIALKNVGSPVNYSEIKGEVYANFSDPDGHDFTERTPYLTIEFEVLDGGSGSIAFVPQKFYSMDMKKITGQVNFYEYLTAPETPATEPETTESYTTEPVTTIPESTTVEPEETTIVPEETTIAPVEEETTEPEETTVPEETTAPEETTEPEETTSPEETTAPSETTYTVIYSYNDGKKDTSVTKTYTTSEEKTAAEIAGLCMPVIESPYYTYSVESASVEGTVVNVQLKGTKKKYIVILNGEEYSSREYLSVETIKVNEPAGFIIDGKVVAVGTEFKFFVTGNMDITTDTAKTDTDEFAEINFNSLRASEDYVYMELLASAKVKEDDYSRMGVAFKTTESSEDDIKAAINEVATGTKKASNGIAVHNSSVTKMNSSGQYQYIYVPYLSTSLVNNPDMKIYFRSFVVKNDGTILLSEPQEVKPYNAIA